MSKVLIIDGNNRAWAAFHAYSRLKDKGRSVSMIYGLPSMIKYLIKEYEPSKVFVVWDGARSKHRIKLHPGYKGEREHKTLVDYEDFLRQKKLTMAIIHYLGIPQIINPKQEADDMIYKLTRVLPTKGFKEGIIVSGDKDFWQLISKSRFGMNIEVYSESKKMLLTWANFQFEFGFKPWQTVDYLTLIGDKSDNIPGYPQIGEKRATELLAQYGSIENFIDSPDKHSIIDKHRLLEIAEKNRILIDLKEYHSKYKDELKIMFYRGKSNPKINREKFLRISGKYRMNKFMASGFLQGFKILKR